jgi:hypothetical protein
MLEAQVEHAKQTSDIKDLKGLLHSGKIFEIK